MNKIKMAKEIIEAMVFLNISTEQFSVLKNEKGGLVELHNYMASLLS